MILKMCEKCVINAPPTFNTLKLSRLSYYLRQHLVFSSSSHAAAMQSESALWLPLCLKLLDISFSSSSLELQFKGTISYCVPSCSLEKWHSSSWITSRVQALLAKANGPDLLAGVLCRGGDEILTGVWHLEVVELPSGVISVPMSLCWTTSVQASCIAPSPWFLNKNPSLAGSKYLKFGKTGSMLSVNLSALQFTTLVKLCSPLFVLCSVQFQMHPNRMRKFVSQFEKCYSLTKSSEHTLYNIDWNLLKFTKFSKSHF